MPKMTPGYTRNVIRRALSAIVDREPTRREIDELWAYFRSTCAYCGAALVRSAREGHIDHLESASSGGYHRISNRVLACRACDSEKDDKPWRSFLKTKVPDARIRGSRVRRITEWAAAGNLAAPGIPDPTALEEEAARAIDAFDGAVRRLRAAVDGGGRPKRKVRYKIPPSTGLVLRRA